MMKMNVSNCTLSIRFLKGIKSSLYTYTFDKVLDIFTKSPMGKSYDRHIFYRRCLWVCLCLVFLVIGPFFRNPYWGYLDEATYFSIYRVVSS